MKREAGTYALILNCPCDQTIDVGRLGTITFAKSYYIYVGSAFGPGGVAARVARHCRTDKLVHWHIDYVRTAMTVTEVWYTHEPEHREHLWARIISASARCRASITGFGSTGCECESHLFYYRPRPSLSAFRRELSGTCSKCGAMLMDGR